MWRLSEKPTGYEPSERSCGAFIEIRLRHRNELMHVARRHRVSAAALMRRWLSDCATGRISSVLQHRFSRFRDALCIGVVVAAFPRLILVPTTKIVRLLDQRSVQIELATCSAPNCKNGSSATCIRSLSIFSMRQSVGASTCQGSSRDY